ncbi:MAG: cation-transporting P-type ATPase [Candidatus Dojkabacteria bacterium]|nr:cation-transporting P-type ATPase [Candidatus Dojkabacteria bacterium]MDQ7021851.1 cation-transporting P-type ATPase [Candidatus Dojkabacteria bacterium]
MKYKGLSLEEAKKRLEIYGKNILTTRNKTTAFDVFIKQIKSPLIYILVFTSILSLAVDEIRDAIFILVVVLINTMLGFIQEYRAENTLSALRSNIGNYVKVIREGTKLSINSEELVPGDIIPLEPGLKIPGDGYILEGTELLVNEAIITGESAAVNKHYYKGEEPNDLRYVNNESKILMGTVITNGLGFAKIIDTGERTVFGKIAESIDINIDPETPTKKKLAQITSYITALIAVVTIIILILGIVRGLEFKEILLTSVALGVSTIPEGLIISFTVILALGMNRIMKKNAIVKNLPAAETLGSVDVLCIDKTGTLTHGKMSIIDTDFNNNKIALNIIALCNNESNLVDNALKEYFLKDNNEDKWNSIRDKKEQIFPFASSVKYTATTDLNNIYVVGAAEIILERSINADSKWGEIIKEQSLLGKRIIALAYKEKSSKVVSRKDIKDLNFIGLAFIDDPVRESAKKSLALIDNSGIDLKVITGDLKETTLHVLNQVGLDLHEDEIISGKELALIKSDKNLSEVIKRVRLFYRTTPDQKLRIVNSLKRDGLSVAMMGDGVNDAPALKNAQIGISVDTATDVSKEVSDIVLLDSNFQTIVDAIEEGRNIFKNSRKISMLLFGDSLSETVIIFLSLIFGYPLPLLPVHLLWINLLEDSFPGIAIGFDKSKHDLLDKKNKPTGSFLGRNLFKILLTVSLIKDVGFFIIFAYLIDNGYSLVRAQTLMLGLISVTSTLFIFSWKTIDSNIWKENIFNNKYLNLSAIVSFITIFLAIYTGLFNRILSTTPLESNDVIIIAISSLVGLVTIETIKFFYNKSHQI